MMEEEKEDGNRNGLMGSSRCEMRVKVFVGDKQAGRQ
jgi:hypothetical protein